ncbi:hypothetical protein ACQP0C_27790 [Nocardia sp. CA-129566]|uniref:hypothetical protein n=1 Tax=Nocardia sp. CA-129566 TaxID=3239976 RepID=UPI003D988284
MNESGRDEAPPTKAMTRVVEGRLFMEREGLAVAPDCLGKVYETVIGGQPLKVLFPAPDPQDMDTLPVLAAPEMLYEHPPVIPQVAIWEWGKINSADRDGWVRADITRLVSCAWNSLKI